MSLFMSNDKVLRKGHPEMELTSVEGFLSIDQSLSAAGKAAVLGLQIAKDGRVWICIDGQSVIRFRPAYMTNKELMDAKGDSKR